MSRAQLLRQEALVRLDTHMGPWHITKLLGLGGSGAVYLAHDGERHGALKTLHQSHQHDTKQRARFEREARVISELSHPNIVQMLDRGEDGVGDAYFVMELLEGAPLEQMMRRYQNKLDPRQAIFVLRGLLLALAAVHAKGIIHRDIKPQNLFITTQPTNVKLLDFGVAHDDLSTEQLTMHGAVLGTPAFMSPEQARGRLDMLDERSDLYSCGALFFTILTGTPIHPSRTAEEGLLLAATKPFKASSHPTLASILSPPLIAFVEQALSWNPSRRYQSAQEMIDALDAAWLATHDATSSTPPPTQSAQKAAAIAHHAAPAQTPPETILDDANPAPQQELASPLATLLIQSFQCLERALDARRKYGHTHREYLEQLQRAFEALIHTLAHHDGPLKLLIRPYSLNHDAATIWEPSPPFDELPYNLFSSGLRAVEFDAALSLEEFSSFVATLTKDPRHDLDLEDDLGMVLWEQNFQHITLHMVTSFRVGDLDTQRDFEHACQEALDANMLRLQNLQATHMQRAQLLLAIGEEALHTMRSQLLANPSPTTASPAAAPLQTLSHEELQRLRHAAAMPRGDLWQRAPYMLSQVYLDTNLPEPDRERFSQGLRHAFLRMSRKADGHSFLAFYTQLILATHDPHARHTLTQDLWSDHLLDQLFHTLTEDPSLIESRLDALKTLLSCLDHRALRHVCTLYPLVQNTKPLVALCFQYIKRHIAHDPLAIATLIPRVALPHVRLLLDLLEALDTQDAAAAAKATLQHPEITPEILTRQYQWSATHALDQAAIYLEKLLQFDDPAVRIRTLQRTKELPDIPAIHQILQPHLDPHTFSQRPYSERRLLFDLLLTHDLYAARDRAIEILQTHKLSGPITTSRQLAIEVLTEVPPSPALFAALEDATKRRPWNTRHIQDAAQLAIDRHRQHRSPQTS